MAALLFAVAPDTMLVLSFREDRLRPAIALYMEKTRSGVYRLICQLPLIFEVCLSLHKEVSNRAHR